MVMAMNICTRGSYEVRYTEKGHIYSVLRRSLRTTSVGLEILIKRMLCAGDYIIVMVF
jgi:hypothetical protein